jgi:hypothetical protein
VTDTPTNFSRAQCACNDGGTGQPAAAGVPCDKWQCSGKLLSYFTPNLAFIALGLVVGGPAALFLILFSTALRAPTAWDSQHAMDVLSYLGLSALSSIPFLGVCTLTAYGGGVPSLLISLAVLLPVAVPLHVGVCICKYRDRPECENCCCCRPPRVRSPRADLSSGRSQRTALRGSFSARTGSICEPGARSNSRLLDDRGVGLLEGGPEEDVPNANLNLNLRMHPQGGPQGPKAYSQLDLFS